MANLRIEKHVSTDGGTSFESTERYALDGSDVVLVFDENDTIEHTYFHGAAVDQIFSDDSAVGELLWALSDHQGTVRDWISADDANSNESDPTQHVTYSAFGEILSATDEATLPRYSYTGREWDADADLYYYRNRWYDPVIGKFANDDPIGFSAGDRNLQRYVGNNAPNMRDPEGLSGGPNFPLVVDSQGRSFIIQSLRASGDQKTDLAWANKWIKDNVDSGFKGAKALKGTWHHKSFNEKTGTFLMELVDSKAHKAGHAGAFADYLEWISKTVKGGKIDKLSKLQKSALFAALKNKGTLGRLAIDKYLSKEAVSVAVKKLEKEGWEVVVSKSGERGVKLSGKLIGKGVSRTFLVTVTKVGAKYGLTVVFAAAAAKNAYAETGEVSAALEAAGRDVVMAEMVEGGVQFVVVEGGKTVFSEALAGDDYLRKRFSTMSDRERAEMVAGIQNEWREFQKNYSWDEWNEEIRKETAKQGGFWKRLGRELDNVLLSDEYKE